MRYDLKYVRYDVEYVSYDASPILYSSSIYSVIYETRYVIYYIVVVERSAEDCLCIIYYIVVERRYAHTALCYIVSAYCYILYSSREKR